MIKRMRKELGQERDDDEDDEDEIEEYDQEVMLVQDEIEEEIP
jgi:hypothetical protein